MNGAQLGLFVSRLQAIGEEMGAVLRRSAISPNIKDRLDYSCAIFDREGLLLAQAAHIPVHLGSMAYAMAGIVSKQDWQAGDILIVNDPFNGGTHLPDVTLICPVFVQGLQGFVVNRAHHANIGCSQPGSMPLSTHVEDEGLLLSPQWLRRSGQWCAEVKQLLVGLNRDPTNTELSGDIAAQISALELGLQRLKSLLAKVDFDAGVKAVHVYGEALAKSSIRQIRDGEYNFTDVLDDDGFGAEQLAIHVKLTITGDTCCVDFAGSADQVRGNINCPVAVVAAAVMYCFRCLMPEHTPDCGGLFRPITLRVPQGCMLNAVFPAATAAGNVETSSRVVDTVFGALAQALPEKIAAASQGTMNNVAMGSNQPGADWDYYETIAGGHGAGPNSSGASASHSHMTNTLNTPIEVLETSYPLLVQRYQIRRNSGGGGKYYGGNGLLREFEFLQDAQVSLLTERRKRGPWGLAGGEAGACGSNSLNGQVLPGKIQFAVNPGDRLTIATPGGGGWGQRIQKPSVSD